MWGWINDDRGLIFDSTVPLRAKQLIKNQVMWYADQSEHGMGGVWDHIKQDIFKALCNITTGKQDIICSAFQLVSTKFYFNFCPGNKKDLHWPQNTTTFPNIYAAFLSTNTM